MKCLILARVYGKRVFYKALFSYKKGGKMALKEFPKALYKGNSVNVKFNIEDKDTGEAYVFQVGDKVKVGIKSAIGDTNYILYKEFEVTQPGDSIALILTPQETDISVTEEDAILEIELEYNGGVSVKTVYQDKIKLEGVVIDG